MAPKKSKPYSMDDTDCLIVVDLQNDFCPGGALGVPDGDAIIEPVNRLMDQFPFVVSTQDWHPPDHCSFKDQGGPWPPHCVQNTPGAALHRRLKEKKIHLKIHKGKSRERDAYSGFQGTELAEELKKRGIRRIFVTGLATDYCVRHTALDGLRNHFKVVVLTDLVRAVNVRPGDGDKALEEIQRAGGTLAASPDLVQGRLNP